MKFDMLKWIAPVSTLVLTSACGSVAPEEVSTASQALYETNWSGTRPQQATDISVTSHGDNLLDQFTVVGGQVIYSSYQSSNWQPDFSLGAPSGKTVSKIAATNNGTRLDVFAVASDNHIWHRHTFPTLGVFSAWQADIPGNPVVAANSPIAVTSWTAGRLDLFWWTPSFKFGHSWATNNTLEGAESGDSASAPYLQPLLAYTSTQDITAVSWGNERIDLFAVSPKLNIELEHHWYDGSDGFWGPTGTENREVMHTLTPDSSVPILWNFAVAGTSRGPGNLELYITAQDGSGAPKDVYHVAFNGTWSLMQNGFDVGLRCERLLHPDTSSPYEVGGAVDWSDGNRRLDVFGSNNGGSAWQAFTTY